MLDARTLTSTPHGACTVSMLTLIGGVVALSALARSVAAHIKVLADL